MKRHFVCFLRVDDKFGSWRILCQPNSNLFGERAYVAQPLPARPDVSFIYLTRNQSNNQQHLVPCYLESSCQAI